MATTKVIPKTQTTAVAVRKTTAVALPTSALAELEKYAKDDAAKERPSVTKLSLKGGMLAYQGQEMPNNEMEVIILSATFMNTLYLGAYDPDKIVNPDCFALAMDEEDLKPHEDVADPYGSEDGHCKGCPNAEWGTGLRDGKPTRGKLCKEKRRLVVMPAEDGADYAKSELAILEISVTNVGHYASYVNTLAASIKRPMWAVRTLIKVSRHRVNQYQLDFSPVGFIETMEELDAIKGRRDAAMRLALMPFSAKTEEEEPAPPPAKGKGTPVKTGAKAKY
jgi:hypothetical protein